ncbi:hypothetical protein BG015_011201 [Linnemannia schmuckeri]|uniref:Calcineurin-like phosphoesterase domain-containing protein n=1 Tax=Linnemannia schmuckeri TaxID=64567 RepID=A0A9P5VEI6_9FUNG|nr:hypothetical protein BG015_011201 [Linnemannia schmuckeri]
MLARIILGILYTATGLAIIGTIVLQNHARIACHWNWDSKDSFMRMVVFADPQMEGDAKIRRLGKRAHVDLAFNDAYMRHIYKQMMSSSWEPLALLSAFLSKSRKPHTPRSPTHVSILGDLFSSQWIDDAEFDVRVARYRSIFPDPSLSSGAVVAGEESSVPVMINITGNHDIGYGYDISQDRVERWEQVFGKSNFISSMDIPVIDADGASENDTNSRRTQSTSNGRISDGSRRRLHLVVLNTMLLDGPSSDENLRGQTWKFLQEASLLKENNPKDKIVLLTHIPFHKEQGICVDPPDIRVHWDNTIIEQTMLTPNTTQWILNTLRPDFVLNGHDHYGCDVVHTLQHGQDTWIASATTDLSLSTSGSSQKQDEEEKQKEVKGQAPPPPPALRVREITQRSMMAEFGGYSGLFEIKIPSYSSLSENNNSNEEEAEELEFHYTACGFFNDLQVWIVIITDLVVVLLWAFYGLVHLITSSLASLGQARKKTHFLPSEKQKLL